MTAPTTVVLLPAAARAVGSAIGDAHVIGSDRPFARLVVDVSAVAAGGSVTVNLETARSVSGGWVQIASATRDAVGAVSVPTFGLQGLARVSWTVAGGPVTFDTVATVEQSYCTPQNIAELSLPPGTLSKVPIIDQALACIAATDEAVSYLAASHDMPLTSWGNALRLHVANMAAYHAMKRRGMNPDKDTSIRLGYTDALAWLKGPARTDPTIKDTTPTTSGATAVFVTSQPARGWRS